MKLSGYRQLDRVSGERKYVALEATIEAAEVREETYQGRTYLVAPVVALVEGVIQGINSENPELALASVFGETPAGWNGRPVVMDHPQDASGEYVSANSPDVLENWAFGQVFNTHLDGSKLKMEAWIDVAAAETNGGNFSETVSRLSEGELVEVSVGVFLFLEEKSGVYQGQEYAAVWAETVPDHLALLSNGSVGACSVERGCGAPRVNKVKPMTNTAKKPKMSAQAHCQCGDGNGSGSTCSCKGLEAIAVPSPPSLDLNKGKKKVSAAASTTTVNIADNRAVFGAEELVKRVSATLSVNALPANRFNNDIHSAIRRAVSKKFEDAYCYGYTTDYVVFDQYDYANGSYSYFKVGINVSEDLEVTFTSEATEVTLVTNIIEKTEENPMTVASGQHPANHEANPGEDTEAAASPDATTTTTTTEEPKDPATAEAPASATTEEPAPSSNPDDNAGNTAVTNNAAKPTTLAEYIGAAPTEIREVLTESVAAYGAQKKAVVASILSTNKSPYDEAQLMAKPLDELRKLAAFAGATRPATDGEERTSAPADYSGRGIPRDLAAGDDRYAPDPPALFEVKKTA